MTEYSRWFNIRGKLSNCEYSEIKNTVMFSTFTVCCFSFDIVLFFILEYATSMSIVYMIFKSRMKSKFVITNVQNQGKVSVMCTFRLISLVYHAQINVQDTAVRILVPLPILFKNPSLFPISTYHQRQ
jgi:hypothetical protein